MPYRKPRPSSAAFRIRASVVVGLNRKIVSRPAAASVVAELAGLLDRQIEREHAVDAGRGGRARANASSPIRSSGFA